MTHTGAGQVPASLFDRANETAQYLLDRAPRPPQMLLVLGSGLGAFAESLESSVVIPYEEIPHFATVSVPGHAGSLVLGEREGVSVAVMSGRFHFYEGYDFDTVTFPVRAARQAGARLLFVTNSSGGLNASFSAGDLMVIEDHINLTGTSPLIGPNEDRFGPRFPDMTESYDRAVRREVLAAADEMGIHLQRGVYVGLTGPTYETPAEVRMLRLLGGDAVGMSTVPEVIVARHAGMSVGGVSCVANLGAGLTTGELSHDEIKEAAAAVKGPFIELLNRTLARLVAADYDLSPIRGSLPNPE